MSKIKIKTQKSIINYIINNFNCPMLRIDKYLMNYAEEITKKLELEIDADDIVYELGDIHNINSNHFIKLLQKEIKNREPRSRIIFQYKTPFYYIKLSQYGKIVNSDIRIKIERKLNIFKTIYNKGYKFQKFCAFFLSDIGAYSIISKNTNDNGIDIIGRNKMKLDNYFQKYFYYIEDQFVLSQVKCHQRKINVNVIKTLIKDSFKLRFKEDEKFFIGSNPAILIVFSYTGFSQCAITYAKKYGVCLISGDDIIDLLCCIKNLENLKCIKYIEDISKL